MSLSSSDDDYLQSAESILDELRAVTLERDQLRQQLAIFGTIDTPHQCNQCKELLEDCYLLREKLCHKNDQLKAYSSQLDLCLNELANLRDELAHFQSETSSTLLNSTSSTLLTLSNSVKNLETSVQKTHNNSQILSSISTVSKEMSSLADVIFWCSETISSLIQEQSSLEQTVFSNTTAQNLQLSEPELNDDDVISSEVSRLKKTLHQVNIELPIYFESGSWYLNDKKLHIVVQKHAPNINERVLVRSGGGFVSLAEFLTNTRVYSSKPRKKSLRSLRIS
ncbi:hypothetical protein RCL1_001033 [Eukaryota sp. TZLM3-RCL]